MSHAIVPAAAVILCLALAGVVSYDLAPLVLKPRPRRGSAGLPAIDPKVLAFMRAGDVAPTRTDLPIPPPRNGVRLQDRPRQTVDVIICDPAVTPVVPGYYRAWLEGRFRP